MKNANLPLSFNRVTFLVFCFCSFVISSQNIRQQRLDSLFDLLAQNNKAMGSVCISKNGKNLYQRSLGYSRISRSGNVPAGLTTKYRVGSISKMFTAAMIFQLIDEKKIGTNTRLSEFYPALPNAKKITIAHLLSHQSGLHSFTSDSDYMLWMTEPKTKADMLAIMAKASPEFAPGKKSDYSNTNYVLLGYIIEDLSGKPYSENLDKRICKPLNLQNTYYGKETDPEAGESFSYFYSGGWQQMPETHMSIPGGAGAIVSTPEDLDKFIQALFTGKLISPKSLDKMTRLSNGYGHGIFPENHGSKKGFGHGGSIDGFMSKVCYFPADSMAIAYTGNAGNYPPGEIMKSLYSAAFNEPFTLPDFTAVKLDTADLEACTGIYASKTIPHKITVSRKGRELIAQATGQSSFTLEAIEKNKFRFDPAGLKMDFMPEKGEMILKQGGADILFRKE